MLISIAICALASTQTASADDLQRALNEIEALRNQNAQLAAQIGRLEDRVNSDGAWLTQERADEIRAIVADTLADSATRMNLAADGAVAGWDKSKGFFLASADGNYTLGIKGATQFRWAYNSREIGSEPAAAGSTSSSTADDAWGFEFRRARLTFFGNIVDPSWFYEVKLGFARVGGDAELEDAFLQKDFGGGWSLRAGQFKLPFLREFIDSANGLLAVERSLVNTFFSAARSQGLELAWESDSIRFEGYYGEELEGRGTAPYSQTGDVAGPLNAGQALGVPGGQNSSFTSVSTDYAFIARAEYKIGGAWRQFRDMQSFRGEEAAALFGIAGYIQQVKPISNADGATPDVVWSATTDARIDFGGASIFVYGVYRNVGLQEAQVVRDGGDNDSLSQWGAVAQGGYFVTDSVEAFLRYETGNSDTDQYRTAPTALNATGEKLSVATIGANWWPAGVQNKIKLTADFGYSFDPLVDFAASGANYLPDFTAANGTTNKGQWVVRSQLQFQF